MTLNERNYAGDHVVVGSLEVLGAVKGGNITEIRRNIDLIQKQTEFMGRQQNEYWKELSSDGVITPLEKQQLLKEIRSIQQSQAAIIIQARSVGQEESQYVQDYLTVYNDLYTYLYNTLKLFDNMEQSSDIQDRSTFNDKFTAYYYDESFVLIALTKGIMSSLNIRVLTSLLEAGEEGEVAIYRGGLYQYVNGAWKNVSTGNYKGALTDLPLAEQDSFFLAADDFALTDILYVNDEPLYVNNDELGIMRLYRKGYIYYCHDGLWYEQTDRTNYMYVAAFADVLNVTGELPQIFQDALDDMQDQIDSWQSELLSRAPRYRGPSATDPSNPVEGDYFVYTGTTTAYRRNSDIYKYTNGAWTRLDPTQSQNGMYYMNALEDVLSLNNADNGYFAALFANVLMAHDAILYELSTKILKLRTGGYIQSENWSSQSAGFRLDHDGNIDANGNTHIGGNCTINGNTTISGNAVIGGTLNGATGTFAGNLVGGAISGTYVYADYFAFHNLQAGDLICKNVTLRGMGASAVSSYSFTWRPWAKSSTSKVTIGIDLGGLWTGHGLGTVYASVFIKRNGTASTSSYDYKIDYSVTETNTGAADYDYIYKTNTKNVETINETDYFSLLISITSVSGAVNNGGFCRVTMTVGYDKYLPLLGIINEIS